MSDRKESLKKTLGISEYPWSSDDDENVTQTVPELPVRPQNEPDMGRSNLADAPGTSGQQTTMASTQTSRQDQIQNFWSMSLNSPRTTSSVITVNRNRNEVLVSRHTHAAPTSGERAGAQDVQRVLAFRRLSRKAAAYRASRSVFSENLSYINGMQCAARAARLARGEQIFRDLEGTSLGEEMSAMMRPSSPARSEMARQSMNPSTSGYLEPNLPVNPLLPAVDILNATIHPHAEAVVEAEETQMSEALETSAMSLEEVALIEPDSEPAPAPPSEESPAPPLPPLNVSHEEPTATTSSANDSQFSPSPPRSAKRKRESDDDNSEIRSVREFNQGLLRLLECPVCLEWMEPPMSQCRRGHLVCGRCRTRLAACPVCRTAFSSVRNRAMEAVAEMIRYPCRHGCGRPLPLRRRAAHEASCPARRYRCPAAACDVRPPLLHADLAPHFQCKHPTMLKMGRAHKFSMKVNSEQHSDWLILALRQLFHLRVDVDIRSWGVVVYVAYIGPKCNADDYTYEVTVNGQHNSRKLVYTRATHCDLECSSLTVSRQDCFHLTLDQALNFLRVKNRHCEPDKYLNFNVEISGRENNGEQEESDS